MCQPTSVGKPISTDGARFLMTREISLVLTFATYKLTYWTICHNYIVAVVFVNRLRHTPVGLELVSRKWGC